MSTRTRTRSKAQKLEYQAVCLVCYTPQLYHGPDRRAADRACTGHLNAYGHNVTVLVSKPADQGAATR